MRRHAETVVFAGVLLLLLAAVAARGVPDSFWREPGLPDSQLGAAPEPVEGSSAGVIEIKPPADQPRFSAGQQIQARAVEAIDDNVRLVATDAPPLISLAAALEVLVADGIDPLATPGVVVSEAYYGIGTLGEWIENQDGTRIWAGPTDRALKNGEHLERIENRPMWLVTFDFSNSELRPLGNTHISYVIDAKSREWLKAWFYDG